jgi:hypothetical protein
MDEPIVVCQIGRGTVGHQNAAAPKDVAPKDVAPKDVAPKDVVLTFRSA